MIPIKDQSEITALQAKASEMTQDGHNISLSWARQRGWTVVPTEDGSHIADADIPTITAGLRAAGFLECFAIATEALGDLHPCYSLNVEEADFKQFNRALSPFRFLLTDGQGSWAISCTEDYLLFAGPERLVQAMLPVKIENARATFLRYAEGLRSENLRKVAVQYGRLGENR